MTTLDYSTQRTRQPIWPGLLFSLAVPVTFAWWALLAWMLGALIGLW